MEGNFKAKRKSPREFMDQYNDKREYLVFKNFFSLDLIYGGGGINFMAFLLGKYLV